MHAYSSLKELRYFNSVVFSQVYIIALIFVFCLFLNPSSFCSESKQFNRGNFLWIFPMPINTKNATAAVKEKIVFVGIMLC